MTSPSATPDARAGNRAGWFTLATLTVVLVGDGWSGRPSGIAHQVLLLPCTAVFLFSVWRLLFSPSSSPGNWTSKRALVLCCVLECIALALFVYEDHHFARVGYHIQPWAGTGFLLLLLAMPLVGLRLGLTPHRLLVMFIAAYGLGLLLAILSFPLNYLRSDMLPVIQWADTNLVHGISPYATMYVGGRVYDFPYLPGMLVVYLPFAWLDPRLASIVAMDLAATYLFLSATLERRLEVACLIGLLLLDPFLQYRHDLYLQPHWLTLVGAFLLLQRGRYIWGAFVLGLGMAIYQFSWIVLPFVLLNALWRRGWRELLKQAAAAAGGILLLVGPFLRSAFARISSNTVGQWGRFTHAIADPMNLSWWITFLLPPHELLRIQAVLLVSLFVWCAFRRRCATLEDTLRWTSVALTLFILCNSIVDGYFYLMLLVPLLLFTLVANGWLRQGPEHTASLELRSKQLSAA